MRVGKRAAYQKREAEQNAGDFGKLTMKQPFWKEKTPSSKGLEVHGSEHQTNIVKSKKLTSELSSINDKVPHREGVVKKEQEFVDKESKALEEALDDVSQARTRLDIQQKQLGQEKTGVG